MNGKAFGLMVLAIITALISYQIVAPWIAQAQSTLSGMAGSGTAATGATSSLTGQAFRPTFRRLGA